MRQKILVLTTSNRDLRSAILVSDPVEDPSRYDWSQPNLSQPLKYDCVLAAMSDGWRLLGAPLEIDSVHNGPSHKDWEWYLYQDI